MALNTFRNLSAVLIFIVGLTFYTERSAAEDMDTLVSSLRFGPSYFSRTVLISEDMNILLTDLQSNREQMRMAALDNLGRMRNDKAARVLMIFVGIRIEDWRMKNKAISLLGDIARPIAADFLTELFTNPDLNEDCPAIKWNTVLALGNFKNNAKVVNTLIVALKSNSLYVREAAIQSLGKIGNSDALPFLIPALKDESFAIRYSAIRSLENIGDPKAIPHLKRIAETDGDPYLKNAADYALKVLTDIP